jgi:phosphate transport system permease protein
MSRHLIIRKIKNNVFKSAVFILALLASVPLLLILYYLGKEGISALDWNFIVNLPKPVGEVGGGVSNAIVGTLMLILISSVISIPLGVTIGIFISEFRKNRITYFVKLCTDVLQGTPSIVIGLVAYLWIVKPIGSFSALSGGVALSIMMLPVIISSTEETLKLIPSTLKESSFALGVPYYSTIIRVVLPAALNGIVTGVMLSIARIAGETAPLLFTAFGNPFMNLNLMKPIASLPQTIFVYSTSPYTELQSLAWGASFVLIILILALNISAKILAKRWRVTF